MNILMVETFSSAELLDFQKNFPLILDMKTIRINKIQWVPRPTSETALAQIQFFVQK